MEFRFSVSVSSRKMGRNHPAAAGRRTVYVHLDLGRRTFWVQRWPQWNGRPLWTCGVRRTDGPVTAAVRKALEAGR